MSSPMLRNYTRWRRDGAGRLHADILGSPVTVQVDQGTGTVALIAHTDQPLSPDEARMIGVRLIDAAVLADGDRAIRASGGHG